MSSGACTNSGLKAAIRDIAAQEQAAIDEYEDNYYSQDNV